MNECVAMSDCDGVLADSVPVLTEVSVEFVGKFFPTEKLKEQVEELVASFGGGSFTSCLKRALEYLYPGEGNRESREKCYQTALETLARRESIYDQVRPFPRALETIKKIAMSYHLVLSSGLERTIIYNWLGKAGFIKGLFEEIYGLEDGEKHFHIELVRKKFPGATVIYIGDSYSDMKLGDYSIGVARKASIQEQLLREGAKAVVSSIGSLERVLEALALNKI